jgi:Na+-translocating ferredoxin:NAD+ oxidoreductase subunit G
MKQTMIIGGKLALICTVAAIALGLVNSVAEPRIELIKKQKLEQALETVSGGRRIGEVQDVEGNETVQEYYPLFDSEDRKIGYILRLIGLGYGGDMVILAGYRLSGEVVSAKLMENAETPGLGKKAEKQEYMETFIGTGADTPVPTQKDQLPQFRAEAITGATITFAGIGKALKAGTDFIKSLGDSQ